MPDPIGWQLTSQVGLPWYWIMAHRPWGWHSEPREQGAHNPTLGLAQGPATHILHCVANCTKLILHSLVQLCTSMWINCVYLELFDLFWTSPTTLPLQEHLRPFPTRWLRCLWYTIYIPTYHNFITSKSQQLLVGFQQIWSYWKATDQPGVIGYSKFGLKAILAVRRPFWILG